MKNIIRNERGILALDFTFALTMGISFALVFFVITLTLSYMEVAQYFSFAVARASWAAHETRTLQVARGDAKYKELRDRPIFKAIFKGDWFQLPERPDYGPGMNGFNDEYPAPGGAVGESYATFIGARLHVHAKILNVKAPMLGSSTTTPETGKASVQTFLNREVTTEECRDNFNAARYSRIRQLGGGGGNGPYQNVPSGRAELITDNGC